MHRHNPLPHPGSDPESRFDHWLDALVTGTPGSDASRPVDPTGQLARAQSGARQLHDLAAQPAMPWRAAQQRIKEDLMHSGALAAPSGRTWKPKRNSERHIPWWSPASPVLATAVAIAVIVSLAASLFWTQRQGPSPTPTDAPGFAVSSPDTTPVAAGQPSDLFVASTGAEPEISDGNTAIGTLGEDGLTLPNLDGKPAVIPDVTNIEDSGIPGRAIVTRENSSHAVIDLSTGEMLFDLPSWEPWSQYFSYIFTPVDDGLTDWTITDLRTGDTRLLSDLVDLPGDASMLLDPVAPVDIIGEAPVFRVRQGEIVDLQFVASDPAVSTFVIAGSLDRAVLLPDFPTALDRTGYPLLAVSADGKTVAYETREGDDRIIFLDTTTGEEIIRFGTELVGNDPSLGGFTEDGEHVVVTADDRILLLTGQADVEPVFVVQDGLDDISNPLLYTPDAVLYFRQVDKLMRLDMSNDELTEVTSGVVPGQFSFTKPGSSWITFLTQDGQTLVDARSGEVVSQMRAPGNAIYFTEGDHQPFIDEAGDTFIFAALTGPPGPGPADSPQTAWLLSPEFPNGLELTAPEPVAPRYIIQSGFQLSHDGSTVYYFTGERYTEPGDIWMTPLSTEPDWQLLAEDIEIEGYFPLSNNSEGIQTLPAQEFATPLATPGGTPTNVTEVSNLLILEGSPTDDLTGRLDRYGVLDNDGLTITRPDGEGITFPGVETITPTTMPGQALIMRDDLSRSVVDLTTGETLFDLPDMSEHERQTGPYLFFSESGENEEWTVFDLRSGENRPLSEIVELPEDLPAMPMPFGLYPPDSQVVVMHFATPNFAVSPTSDIPSFLIAGSLDNAIALDGYPPATQPIDQLPVVSAERQHAAWITAEPDPAIVIADTQSGEVLARYSVDTFGGNPALAGFTEDEEHLVVTTDDRVLLVNWRNDGEPVFVVRDNFESITNPLLYVPDAALYFRQDNTLMRLDMPNGELSTVLSGLAASPVRFSTPDSPWLVANEGEDIALIDARPGEVVSHLTDVPPNLSLDGSYSVATTVDGSTVLQKNAGLQSEYHAYVVSPGFLDGVVLTPPIDPADIVPDRSFPVDFILSPDGTTVIAGTQSDIGFIPRYMGEVAPEPGWIEFEPNMSGASWIPMPDTEPDSDTTEKLPAQNVTSPVATPPAFEPDLQLAYDIPTNLRTFPRLTAAIVTTLPPGTLLMSTGDMTMPTPQATPTDDSNLRWLNVRTELGEEGWIREIDLEPYTAAMSATPEAASIGQLIPSDVVSVIAPEPWTFLDRSVAGGIGESGLTLPLRNGERYRLPDGASVSQILHTSIAIVEDYDGNRFSLDLETGETLAELPPNAELDQWIGTYLFTPANDDMTVWTITDLRSGDQTGTDIIGGGPFDASVDVRATSLNIDAPHQATAQFIIQVESSEPMPWQGLATDEGPVSGTLVIPGSLAEARFLEGSLPSPWPEKGSIALSTGEQPLLAYVTMSGDERVVVENATTGARVATWSDFPRAANATSTYIAGFSPDNESLVVWTTGGGEGLDTVSRFTWSGPEPVTEVFDMPDGRIDQVFLTETTALVMVTSPVEAGLPPFRWKHLDLESGTWTELPALDGFRVDRAAPGIPWMVLDWITDPNTPSTVIVDKATGEIAVRLDEPDDSMASSRSPSRDFSVIVINRFTGDGGTTGYVLDATSGESWPIVAPQFSGGISYEVSPDGSLLIANGEGPETWIAPISPDPEWTSIGFHTIDSWLYYPDDDVPPDQQD